jgi:hypothetical protein
MPAALRAIEAINFAANGFLDKRDYGIIRGAL